MPRLLYHFTDSARLPYILADEVLRPGKNRGGHFPNEFLWTSEVAAGEQTANYSFGGWYKSGEIYAVRFVLNGDGFFHWSEIKTHEPNWTDRHDQMLLRASRGADTSKWWCRIEGVPLSDVLAIEGRTYRDNRWKPVNRSILAKTDASGVWLGTEFNGQKYMSLQCKGVGDEQDGYQVGKLA